MGVGAEAWHGVPWVYIIVGTQSAARLQGL
jgi:D-alanyl-lipoteichoic acid acyltransferase DltB (MBOAT superfamily)